MCTLTCVPGAWLAPESDGTPLLRVVFNRDERLTRGPAFAPVLKNFGVRRAVLPIDSEAGGTWIAGSDLGAVFALLNVTTQGLPRGAVSDRETRGGIIPPLLDADSLNAVFARMQRLEPKRYAPFRLLCLSPNGVFETWSDGWTLRTHQWRLHAPLMRTSSGLGDRVVADRRVLFERHFARHPIRAADQDAFHHHQWRAHPEFSVLMSRADARTVSITTAVVDQQHVCLSYLPVHRSGIRRSSVRGDGRAGCEARGVSRRRGLDGGAPCARVPRADVEASLLEGG